MRNLHTYIGLAVLVIAALAIPLGAQNAAQERAAQLRQQLAELQDQQEELQTRLQQVEEDLKPENIEKGLAGVGSTRPEDLREQRRRQLEIEKKSLQSRLDQFATSRTRLEAGIAQADADVYHRSAAGPTVPEQAITQPSNNSPTVRSRNRRANKKKPQPRRIRRPVQNLHHL